MPFLQISDNSHKSQVEESPKDARTTIYYKNVMAREMANNTMAKARPPLTPTPHPYPEPRPWPMCTPP